MGKLQEMLNKQRALQDRLKYDIDGMDAKERTAFIKEFSIHLNQEINEMLYELAYFKPWKDYENLTVHQHEFCISQAREEFIDAFHFMLNIALALGLDEDEMFKQYCDKNSINHKRQDEGY